MPDRELICIVDDDADHCDALRFLLENEGYQVKMYLRAEEYLNTGEKDCDCLILDFKMPGINGVELLELLQARGLTPPTIFLTAHADLDMAIKIFKGGAHDLIQKPVDVVQLLQAVGETIEKHQKLLRSSSGSAESAQKQISCLTQREKQVLNLVSMGLMNCQVASRLNLSERTIETHRANAYRKLGISNLAQLRKLLMQSKLS